MDNSKAISRAIWIDIKKICRKLKHPSDIKYHEKEMVHFIHSLYKEGHMDDEIYVLVFKKLLIK